MFGLDVNFFKPPYNRDISKDSHFISRGRFSLTIVNIPDVVTSITQSVRAKTLVQQIYRERKNEANKYCSELTS